MVRQDTTVLVLYSGNFEYLCLRHRGSQTLYVSDLLHIAHMHNPSYGKHELGA